MDGSVADRTPVNYYDKYQVNVHGLVEFGSYGRVYQGSFPGTNEKIAMKVAKKDAQGIPSTTLREVALLKSFKHANIVRLLKVEQDDKNVYCILEYLDHELTTFIQAKKEGSDLPKIRMFMHQILSATHYLHGRHVMHRDLKPANLMINAEGNLLKVVDFGLARLHNVGRGRLTPNRQPVWYRAPEVLMRLENYSCSIDLWSTGCIFAEMISTKPPFVAQSHTETQLTCIFKKLGTPTEESWPGVTSLPEFLKNNDSSYLPQVWSECYGLLDDEGWDLFGKLFVMNPERRISAADALKHPYFTDQGNE